jgi:succinate-semialdehyde dehydrogenase/glutarate-semialdehyde dehydrogenase
VWRIVSINSATNEIVGKVVGTTSEQAKTMVEKAHATFQSWKSLTLQKRIELLQDFAKHLEKNADKISKLMTQEMGKPITQSEQEIARALDYLKWNFENAEKCLSPETTFENDKTIHKVFFEPKGVVLCIQPFNFPISQFIWQTIQNLIVGNVVVSKPDINSPLTAKLIREIIDTSKLPKGVLQICIGGAELGQFLVNQNFDMFLFTGSTKTGEYISKIAGEKMIPAHLELGGSSPAIVCADADIATSAERIFANRFRNSGQVCDCIKRVIVHENKFDELVKNLVNEANNQVVGNPMDKETTIGPLVNKQQLEKLIVQVADAVKNGAKIVYGGKQPKNLKGNFYEPTILTNIKKDMKVWQEEVFGPVLPIVTFKTVDEAIKLGNDTIYGLSACIFTSNKETYEKISKEINAGMIALNDKNYGGAFNPFGGVKASGNARVLGKYGFRELCNIKLITFEK